MVRPGRLCSRASKRYSDAAQQGLVQKLSSAWLGPPQAGVKTDSLRPVCSTPAMQSSVLSAGQGLGRGLKKVRLA